MGSLKIMNCRLCDRDVSGENSLLLYDYDENIETILGRKINIILNSTDKSENLSNYCCDFCTSKIEICFRLLVEIQASDEVIRQIYETVGNGKKVDTTTQLFICGECHTTISGIKLFIKHYENHILKKTTVGSKKDVTISATDSYKSKEADVEGVKILTADQDAQDISSESVTNYVNSDFNDNGLNNSKYGGLVKIVNVKDNSESVEEEKDDDDSLSEQNLISADEYYDAYDDAVTDDGDSIQSSDNENNEDVITDQPDSELIKDNSNSSTQDSVDSDVQSDVSSSSDLSHKKLVEMVKKELVKTDDEDDFSNVVPNKDGRYTCDTCNLTFEYKFILNLHLKKDHKAYQEFSVGNTDEEKKALEDDSNPFIKCCYCKKTFHTSEFKNHLLECREEYSYSRNKLCQICGKMYSLRNLEKHLEEHKKLEEWCCELCGKKFKAKRFLKSHLGEHDESKKKICEICGKKLLPLSFFSHIMKHREKRHVCQYCGKAFTYNYGLRIHMKIHDTNKKSESKPEKKKDKVFCWLCKKDFDCTVALNKHLKSDHNTEGVEQDSRFPCSQCDKKFADMFSLKAHLKLIHEMKDEEIARLKSLPVYRYIECNVCNKVFNSENKIRIHMKQDHGLKPFEMEILKKECEKCGKKFASKQNLIHHINGAHLHIKPMTCDICQEKFAKHSSLIYHKLRHSGEKPFQCEFCQKSYRQRNDVIRHLARHVRDKEISLEEASAVNNSPSRLVIKRRIFLKDSSINYQNIVRKNRRKSEVVEMEPILEEEINEIQEEQMEFNEDGMSESMIYVEEVPMDVNQPESPSELHYINPRPVYNEERNTIILSSPDVVKNSMKNVTYRYIPSQLKHMPAVIVKKQEQI